MRHLSTELIADASGELAGAARDRVARHLAVCAACRAARDEYRQLLAVLRAGAPAPPALHPARYRAELRQKLEARRAPGTARAWWHWPVPLALSAGLTGLLVFLALHGGLRPLERGGNGSDASVPRLDLLRNYGVVERLDLLEDYDLLKSLDVPASRRES